MTSPSKVTSPPEVFKEISAEIVISSEYVCVDEVVTFAPRLEVPDTDNEVALEIAAFRSKIPVILIAPKVCVPPIIPSTCNSEAVTVRLLVSDPSELTVVSKVI